MVMVDKCGFEGCISIRAPIRGRPMEFHDFCEIRKFEHWLATGKEVCVTHTF
jgi:hypothetical protein